MIDNKEDIRRMHDDLLIADDCIRSLVLETQNQFVSEKYIEEKAEKALRCINFVLSFAKEEKK